jgi:hypothetical protein
MALQALTTPLAMVAQLTMPPNTLTRMALTLESLIVYKFKVKSFLKLNRILNQVFALPLKKRLYFV